MTGETPDTPSSGAIAGAATLFGIGHVPRAPGTAASAVAIVPAWGLLALGGWPLLLVATAMVTALGVWAAQHYANESEKDDPSEVVIDELAGQWLALVPATLDPAAFAIAFLAFRALDIAKPWPIWVLQRLPGGRGIMADDIAAGAIAAILVGASRAAGLV